MAPLVSVCLITYNQQQFVAQAIESALMQKCPFKFEVLICDDASTDETPRIAKTYADTNSEFVKIFPSEKNLGVLRNWERALKLCTGKYIALLEGDDFWTDPLKLQKQVAILENDPSYVISCTNATIKYEDGRQGYSAYVTLTGETFTINDLMKFNFIPTCSVLMRNLISKPFFHSAYFKSPFADWIIHIINAQFGKIHFLNEYTCTYRVHKSGVWGGKEIEKQLKDKLAAIDCINHIIKNKEQKRLIGETRKESLQNLCAYYKQKCNYVLYFNYRFKLLLN